MARRKSKPTSINFVPLRVAVILIVIVALGVGSMCGSGIKEQEPAEEQQPVTEGQGPAQSAQTAGKIEQPAALQGVPEQIIEHTGFILSFNKELGQPNWVACAPRRRFPARPASGRGVSGHDCRLSWLGLRQRAHVSRGRHEMEF